MPFTKFIFATAAAFIAFTCNSCMFRQKADLLVHHAHIYTVDSKFSTQEAMVVRDGRIIDLGTNDDMLKKYTAKSMVDAKGQFIYPGFIDAHCHFTGFATDMWKCDLVGTNSFEEVLS